jgi:tetratricopeptide (TPR) repeat protein
MRRKAGAPAGLARSYASLGTLSYHEQQYEEAAVLLHRSLYLWREVDNQHELTGAMRDLGRVARERGDNAAAQSIFEESLSIARAAGDNWGIALGLGFLGTVAEKTGNIRRARDLYEESLAVWQLLREKAGVLDALASLARVIAAEGEPARAARLYGAMASEWTVWSWLPRSPTERSFHECGIAAVRDALDEEEFRAAWEAGTSLSLEEAVAEALARDGWVRKPVPLATPSSGASGK